MSSRVRVLDFTHVRPDDLPTADHTAVVKLSFFDALYVTMAPIQRLFFYESPGLPPFPALVRSLKSSLAATLAVFPLLAGELTHRPDSGGDVVIDCSAHAAVRFVEAEYSGVVDMRCLAADDEHHTEEFVQLVPEVEVGRLPAPVLAVQVTRPAGGGGAVAVGLSVHHAAADGQSVWRFIKAWAAAAREGSPVAAPPPIFDRAVIRHPRAQELTRKFITNWTERMQVNPFPFPVPDMAHQRRRTFLLCADQIQSLKQRMSQSKITGTQQPPTTYVAVSSLVWASLVRAKAKSMDNDDDNEDAYFLLSADCRRRLRPPVDEAYFGNCVMGCCARVAVGYLLRSGDDDGLAHAGAAIQRAIREGLEDPVADMEGRLERRRGLPAERVTVMGSSNRFMGYETDFGWGAPTRVELVSITVGEEVTLLGAREGGVQVSVALHHAHMEALVDNFRLLSEAA